MRKGVPVSPGVALAIAFRLEPSSTGSEFRELRVHALSKEINRFDKACTASIEELDAIIARVTQQTGEEEAAIFRAHRLLSRDPALIAKVTEAIRHRHVDAATALRETVAECTMGR